MHLLGNTPNTMTSIWRLLLDALMFGNFPGFLYADSLGKQLTNIFRVPPGAGADPTQRAAEHPRCCDADAVPKAEHMIQLANLVEQQGQRLGGTADTPIGEGKQNAPVGTTLALIEQATKIVSSVHKGLHQSQSQEFQLLAARFREDPGALWRFGSKRLSRQWEEAEFLQALDDFDIVPAADPNTASNMERIMRAVARVQAPTNAPPGLFDLRAVAEAALRTLGDDPTEFLTDPNAPPPNAGPPPMPPPIPRKWLSCNSRASKPSRSSRQTRTVADQRRLGPARAADARRRGDSRVARSRRRQSFTRNRGGGSPQGGAGQGDRRSHLRRSDRPPRRREHHRCGPIR